MRVEDTVVVMKSCHVNESLIGKIGYVNGITPSMVTLLFGNVGTVGFSIDDSENYLRVVKQRKYPIKSLKVGDEYTLLKSEVEKHVKPPFRDFAASFVGRALIVVPRKSYDHAGCLRVRCVDSELDYLMVIDDSNVCLLQKKEEEQVEQPKPTVKKGKSEKNIIHASTIAIPYKDEKVGVVCVVVFTDKNGKLTGSWGASFVNLNEDEFNFKIGADLAYWRAITQNPDYVLRHRHCPVDVFDGIVLDLIKLGSALTLK